MKTSFLFTNGKHYIEFPIECFIRHDGEFISFEFGEHWYRHSSTCIDCKAFLSDMLPTNANIQWYIENKPFENWFFNDGEDYYQLISNNFSSNGYFDNKISYRNGNKTECKLRIRKCEASDGYMKYFESIEKYEICAFIRDNGE
jgi:hypothetical protein